MNYLASRLLNPYLSLIAGLGLAGGVALAGGGWREASATKLASPTRVVVPRDGFTLPPWLIEPPYRVYYLVSSEAQLARAEQLEFESNVARDSAGLLHPSGPVQMLTAVTPAQEQVARTLIAQQTGDATGVVAQVYDLRNVRE